MAIKCHGLQNCRECFPTVRLAQRDDGVGSQLWICVFCHSQPDQERDGLQRDFITFCKMPEKRGKHGGVFFGEGEELPSGVCFRLARLRVSWLPSQVVSALSSVLICF